MGVLLAVLVSGTNPRIHSLSFRDNWVISPFLPGAIVNPYGYNPYGIPGQAILPPPQAGSPMSPMNVQKNIVRIGEQAFWSSQRYADGAAVASTTDRLFSTPRGQVGQGFAAALTLPETNLKEGGRIPSQFAYDVEAIAVQPYYFDNFPLGAGDLRNMMNHGVLLWDFVQTQIEIAPISLIGAGGGAFGSTADTGAVEGGLGGGRVNLNNGSGQLWVYRRHPVLLPSNSTFALLVSWGGSATVIDGSLNNSALIARVVLLGRFQTAIATG